MAPQESTHPSWATFARQVIAAELDASESADAPTPPETETSATPFGGVFVTLYSKHRLRGCMGTLQNEQSLAQAVRSAAISAAFHDPRFPPLTRQELRGMLIEVSILSPPWPMPDLDALELGRHGILVRHGEQHGLFLPQVALDHRLDKQTYLARCCKEKAGLEPDAWRDPQTEVLLFTTQIVRETCP